MKITLVKKNKEGRTFNLVEIEDVLKKIREGEYAAEVVPFRRDYPENRARQRVGGLYNEQAMRALPQLCFAAQWRKQNGVEKVKETNNLILLELKNLRDENEVELLRRRVEQIPYTMVCFVGASGYDIEIVCQVRYANTTNDESKQQLNLQNACKLLHYHYSVQLQTTLDMPVASMMASCAVSMDSQLFYNPDSELFFVRDEKVQLPQLPVKEESSPLLLPGSDALMTRMRVFEWCFSEAMRNAEEKIEDEDDFADATLHLLSDYCNESGLPMDFAVKRTKWRVLFDAFDTDYINEVFACAYEKKKTVRPLGHVPKSALLTLRTEAFLNRHYELRRNAMTGVVQYRKLDGYDDDFRDLTTADMHSMTNRALKAGLGSWDKDVRRLIESNDIPVFDPAEDYLMNLPRWDGRDRVTPFISRVLPEASKEILRHAFHTWLLSMVAHWLGRDASHGNALVPLLIGSQGCGKTSFCNIILPPALQPYYNDKVEFKNETALALGLSSFALINIDEFDSLKRSQQPTLKYLLSKSDIKLRPPFGTAFVSRRRYASFIATTNNPRPLTDPTGSRRFICISIPAGQKVDFMTKVEYDQLYAQLLNEIYTGARYWLDDVETEELMKHNTRYQKMADVRSMIESFIVVPEEGDETEYITVAAVVEKLCRLFPDLVPSRSLSKEVGRHLSDMGFAVKHTNKGQAYRVKV